MTGRILIGVGANLPHPTYGPPLVTLPRVLDALQGQIAGRVLERSPWFRTAPVPVSDQPWFINAVVQIETALDPTALLASLHRVEDAFGRTRVVRNAARIVDLDLIDFRGQISPGDVSGSPVLPHPRCHERAFVLLPLRDVAPDWRHPVWGETIDQLIDRLPPDQIIERIADSA